MSLRFHPSSLWIIRRLALEMRRFLYEASTLFCIARISESIEFWKFDYGTFSRVSFVPLSDIYKLLDDQINGATSHEHKPN
jgi:hypothetical protein